MAAAAPSLADQISQSAQYYFPTLNAARTSVVNGATAALAAGNPGAAAGNIARGALTLPAGVVNDLAQPLVADAATHVASLGHALAGFFGGNGATPVLSSTDALPAAGAPVVAVGPATGPHAGQAGGLQLTASAAAADALKQGAALRAQASTPQGELGNALQQILGRNPSLGMLAQAAPLISSSVKPIVGAGDQLTAAAHATATSIFNNELEAAGKLPEGPDRSKATQSASEKYFQNLIAVKGANPTNVPIANSIAAAGAQ